jgi:hypothetical protein
MPSINVTLIGYATIDGSCMHVLITEVVGPIIYMGLEHGMVTTSSCTIIVWIIVTIVGINVILTFYAITDGSCMHVLI